MSLFSRWRKQVAVSSQSGSTASKASSGSRGENQLQRPVPNLERSVIALTAKVQECLERLDVIEHRLDDLSESTLNTPSHSDVMEVRMHSAKLAAELARATVELRGEIGMANDETRRAARLARSLVEEEPPVSLPVDVDLTAANAVNIRNSEDDEDGDGTGKGWSASA